MVPGLRAASSRLAKAAQPISAVLQVAVRHRSTFLQGPCLCETLLEKYGWKQACKLFPWEESLAGLRTAKATGDWEAGGMARAFPLWNTQIQREAFEAFLDTHANFTREIFETYQLPERVLTWFAASRDWLAIMKHDEPHFSQDVYTSLRHVAHPPLQPGASAVAALEKLRSWPREQQVAPMCLKLSPDACSAPGAGGISCEQALVLCS